MSSEFGSSNSEDAKKRGRQWVSPKLILLSATAVTLLPPHGSASPIWQYQNGSDGIEIAQNLHAIGFQGSEYALVGSLLDLIVSIIDDDPKKLVFHRERNKWVQLGAIVGEDSTETCQSYFFGIESPAPEFEFGVISDMIDGERHIFIVSNSSGGCPAFSSGKIRTYKLHNLLIHRDGATNVVFVDTTTGNISFIEDK